VEVAVTKGDVVVVVKGPVAPVMFAAAVSNVRPFFKLIVYDIVPSKGDIFAGAKPNWGLRELPTRLYERLSPTPRVKPLVLEKVTLVTSKSASL
jgi:hypothetical protein